VRGPGRSECGRRPGLEHTGDALEVGNRGGDDVDAAVRVVHPVDGNLVDPKPGPLGQHQQLRVEESER
jgi:hypothetical protein